MLEKTNELAAENVALKAAVDELSGDNVALEARCKVREDMLLLFTIYIDMLYKMRSNVVFICRFIYSNFLAATLRHILQ